MAQVIPVLLLALALEARLLGLGGPDVPPPDLSPLELEDEAVSAELKRLARDVEEIKHSEEPLSARQDARIKASALALSVQARALANKKQLRKVKTYWIGSSLSVRTMRIANALFGAMILLSGEIYALLMIDEPRTASHPSPIPFAAVVYGFVAILVAAARPWPGPPTPDRPARGDAPPRA